MIWLILILSLILRFINLNQSLWLDEAINVVYAMKSTFWWYVTSYPIGDFHPPFWFVILWVWGHIFGFSEVSVRLPSVFLGVATVWLTYLLGKDLFNRKIAILASLLLAIAPLHVYYSQESRMYVLAAFAVVLSFYCLNKILVADNRYYFTGFVISLILVFYSDYLVYLIIPAQVFYLLWTKKVKRKVLEGLFVASMVAVPWIFIFNEQFQNGMITVSKLPAWGEVVGGGGVKDLLLIPLKIFFGRVTFLDKTIYLISAFAVGIFYGSLFLLALKKSDQTKLLLSWVFIPIILAFFISFFVPILSYTRVLFILPAFYLILANGVFYLAKKLVIPALIFICLLDLVFLTLYYINPKLQRENWRDAISFVTERLDSQSLIIFENNEIPAPVRYYSDDLSQFKPGLSGDLERDLVDKRKVFLFEYLVDIYDPERVVEQKLESLNFFHTETYDYEGVGFIKLYVK